MEAQKVIENILNSYNLQMVEQSKLQMELAIQILQELQQAGHLR